MNKITRASSIDGQQHAGAWVISDPDCLLLSSAQTYQAEHAAFEGGIAADDVMEQAGKAVAQHVVQYLAQHYGAGQHWGAQDPEDVEIIVLAGPGNNGRDGYVAARHLKKQGYSVCVMPLASSNDTHWAVKSWHGEVASLDLGRVRQADIIVDALFGIGLQRQLTGDAALLVEAANQSDGYRVAIDIASGVSADTGAVLGTAFQAHATVTFIAKKPGHVIAPGRFLSGGVSGVHLVPVGVPQHYVLDETPDTYLNTPSLWGAFYPYSGPATHKYNRGSIVVLGGEAPTLGASRLASMAALRVGAGLVTLLAPESSYIVQATALSDVLVVPVPSEVADMGADAIDALVSARARVLLVGPGAGLSGQARTLIAHMLASGRQCVVDADALTYLADVRHSGLDAGHYLPSLQTPDEGLHVLTPHEGEFARLFPELDFDADRLAAVRAAAQISGAVVVLKGVSTLIAAPDGRAAVNVNAPAYLSVAGTGDVLAGLIAGLCGQGMPAFEAACAGVWIHSEAALEAGRGMIASDMLGIIPSVLP